MDELLDRLEAHVGLPRDTGRAVVAIVVQFLGREAPAAAMAPLVARHPWIIEAQADAPEAPPPTHANRHFGGMARLMELANRMMALGLTMGEVQSATREVVAYARETAGAESVDGVVRAIPGLRQLV
ncbi:DUF2267 domain-containing protein [Xanthobacter pseudotagetidis]|uniref:DUF2267 domain-containing protein n=1 Tax=Xanthobacter pseudotagetidis TaxID=3119911 RepID=UPI0037272274